jgi:hypothetical protein
MFFGSGGWDGPADPYPCPKTHHHAKGHCSRCLKGCFSTSRVDVHLKEH